MSNTNGVPTGTNSVPYLSFGNSTAKTSDAQRNPNSYAELEKNFSFKNDPNMGISITKATPPATAQADFKTPKQLGTVREQRIEKSMDTFETLLASKKEAIMDILKKEFPSKAMSDEALTMLALTQMG